MSNIAGGARTNQPVGDKERRLFMAIAKQERDFASVIEAQITETAAEIAAGEAKLVRDRNALELLRKQHARIIASLQEKAWAIHPLRGFPVDLLREIFLYCAEKHTPNTEQRIKPTIIALSQVCQEWRVVSHATAKLWSYIDIDFDLRIDILKRAAHWIHLSRNSTLNVSLNNVPTGNTQRVDSLMNLLVRVASRWGTLSVSGSEGIILRRTLAVQTPLLTSLDLEIVSNSSNPSFPITVTNELLPDSPRLRRMTITNTPWLPRFPLFSSLEVLRINRGQTVDQDALKNLSEYPALRTLTLDIRVQNNHQTIPRPSSFANLTRLTLANRVSQSYARAETPLAFPSLEELSFKSLEGPAAQLVFLFLRYLPNPERLHNLELDLCKFGGTATPVVIEEFRQSLSRATELRSISSAGYFTEYIISLLTNPTGINGLWLCPRLYSLRASHIEKNCCEMIIQMITSRGQSSRIAGQNPPSALQMVEWLESKPWERRLIEESLHRFR